MVIQPQQIVVLVTVIIVLLLIGGWLLGGKPRDNGRRFEDTVNTAWYGSNIHNRAKGTWRRQQRKKLLVRRIVTAVVMISVGSAILLAMSASLDVGVANGRVTSVDTMRYDSVSLKTGAHKNHVMYDVNFSYYAQGNTCYGSQSYDDTPSPYGTGQALQVTYFRLLPCLSLGIDSAGGIRMIVAVLGVLFIVFGGIFGAVSLLDIGELTRR